MATLLQLKAFLAVVDQGGFTAASRSLGMSQPAVSRAVAGLERELGSPLLIRHRDRILLNAPGKRALAHARSAVRHLDQMRAEVSAAAKLRGTLRIASLPYTTELLIAPQLQKFSERHPSVEIRVLEGGEPEIRDWLDLGAADAGVISLPATGLSAAFLAAQDMVAVLPSEHRLAAFSEVHYADLAKEPFIRSTGGCAHIFMAVADQVGVEFDVAFEAHGLMAVLEIVTAGLGVSIVPVAAVARPRAGIAVKRLVPKTTRNLAVAVSASAGSAARAFLEQIAALDGSERAGA
ncbi:LysR family transcriptional regulator [Mycobacterium avium subsp. hominissuis]|jgi:DNA-binding transcriptional LysR family regulator|uniref:Probable hydrogen peroxide-inducible genes activator n=1 Tax=Mycobacterium avium TaxID=1764 RepID=A0A2A2ZDF5_MYCAV|nr:LysR family transcriptional regulator [Mycobacterium avium]ETZ48455.1 bacterial regulatory helix-turn-helix, lysR family protein [Mycobacterium avium MAV_120809_2495]MDO2394420.1 LysR family transcriptional regulator [Mycobacterium avium subsp. hominissuis]PBA24375.1 LysR family transcriptional regulator [Mycobacterium avium]PBA79009.1 LysR family transcriptional regulator [Mycobacterium avium]